MSHATQIRAKQREKIPPPIIQLKHFTPQRLGLNSKPAHMDLEHLIGHIGTFCIYNHGSIVRLLCGTKEQCLWMCIVQCALEKPQKNIFFKRSGH